jgi:hydroxypyruvate reductase
MINPEKFLYDLFQAGLAVVDPLKITAQYLPETLPKSRVIVIGAGKASAMMAHAVEKAWPHIALEGLVVTRYDYGVPTEKIRVIEAAHPVPDDAGQRACHEMLQVINGLSADDLVIALISGGGSALLSLPAPCLSSDEKRALNRVLLNCGATIHEINCLRKHLSKIKGGQLALAAAPAKVLTLLISDIPGDDPCTIASGPTLPDPTTHAQARAVIEKYKIEISDDMRAFLQDPANETPKPDHPAFHGHEAKIIARAQDALEAAAQFADAHKIKPVILGDDIEGEARHVAKAHIELAFGYLDAGKGGHVLISGGETTVTIKGNGKGGRNTEYLLAAMIAADGRQGIFGIACDTDGIDGSENNAGAFFTPDTMEKSRALGLDASAFLENNDAYNFFEAVGGLIVTGPTYTNVNDFRALLVL